MKKQKQVLMFAKVSVEKVSLTEYQRIEKEQKRNSEVCRAECRKKSSDDCHAIEKAKSERAREMELS
ncbi:MAG: hypothetical protein V3U87_04395 [Methylococcaceae bacterium]